MGRVRNGIAVVKMAESTDIEGPCYLMVSEFNTDTNDEIVIYEHRVNSIGRPNLSSALSELEPYERALRLYAGNGCDIDVQEAISILQGLSEGGSSKAAYKLGEIYSDGSVVEPDFSRAADYFELALCTKNSDDNDLQSI